jgi:hypothetical protein
MDNFYCYALGYNQGLNIGQFERDDYEQWSDSCQSSYKQGYDRGVTDYCLQEVTE